MGQNEIEFEKIKIGSGGLEDTEKEWIKYRIKWMMNAQPDIAVVYHIGEEENAQKFLLFIECKFLSRESVYPSKEENVKQRRVQWMIADFLCKYLDKCNKSKKEIMLSSGMEKDKSRLVRFIRKSETKVLENNRGEIFIEDLIQIDNKIF